MKEKLYIEQQQKIFEDMIEIMGFDKNKAHYEFIYSDITSNEEMVKKILELEKELIKCCNSQVLKMLKGKRKLFSIIKLLFRLNGYTSMYSKMVDVKVGDEKQKQTKYIFAKTE